MTGQLATPGRDPDQFRRWLSGGEVFVDGVDVEAVLRGAGAPRLPAR
jgi:hypothetical protein